jgi:hypothetical protein
MGLLLVESAGGNGTVMEPSGSKRGPPNGKLLAVAGLEKRAMLWDVDPAVWRRHACAIAGRDLTREEWKLHLPPGKPYRATCSDCPTS